jgi:hypothetical protein
MPQLCGRAPLLAPRNSHRTCTQITSSPGTDIWADPTRVNLTARPTGLARPNPPSPHGFPRANDGNCAATQGTPHWPGGGVAPRVLTRPEASMTEYCWTVGPGGRCRAGGAGVSTSSTSRIAPVAGSMTKY